MVFAMFVSPLGIKLYMKPKRKRILQCVGKGGIWGVKKAYCAGSVSVSLHLWSVSLHLSPSPGPSSCLCLSVSDSFSSVLVSKRLILDTAGHASSRGAARPRVAPSSSSGLLAGGGGEFRVACT